jgi:hypothetical protein
VVTDSQNHRSNTSSAHSKGIFVAMVSKIITAENSEICDITVKMRPKLLK